MIRLFNRNETNFNHNECVLTDVTSCKVIEEANGMYEVELEHPKNETAKLLTEGKVLKVPTSRGEQLFRIYKPNPNLKTRKIYAKHIFYDLMKNFLEDVRPTDLTGALALNYILNNTQYSHRFTATSDIVTNCTAYYERKNPVEAIMGTDDNSFINVWGGELVRDNFTFKINQSGGSDRGYEIRLGKNLTGIDVSVDTSDVVTRIMPTVVIDNNTVTKLPEKYIDSPLIDNYECPYVKEVRIDLTDEQKAMDIEDIYAYMRSYCNDLFESGIDLPKTNFKVDFVQLSKTEQYKDLGILEQLDIYDTVTTKISDLDIDVKAKVIKTVYDSLKGRFESIELGDFKTSLASQTVKSQYNINKTISETKTVFQNAIEYATEKITGAKGGYVIQRLNAEGKPYETLYMDTDDINTATKVLRINNEGIGGSDSGYNGSFNVAITLDGLIAAERIVGDIVEGVNIIGVVISNGSGTFYVDKDGNCIANSFNSSNANITGGRINFQTSSTSDSLIKMGDTNYNTSMTAGGFNAIGGAGTMSTSFSPNGVSTTVSGILRMTQDYQMIIFKNPSGTMLISIEGYANGNIWAYGNISAATFTDRTPHYDGDALTELSKVSGDGNGGIDHSTLPEFARKKITKIQSSSETKKKKAIAGDEVEDGRDIGAMVSILTKAIQQLVEKNEEQDGVINTLITQLTAKGVI